MHPFVLVAPASATTSAAPNAPHLRPDPLPSLSRIRALPLSEKVTLEVKTKSAAHASTMLPGVTAMAANNRISRMTLTTKVSVAIGREELAWAKTLARREGKSLSAIVTGSLAERRRLAALADVVAWMAEDEPPLSDAELGAAQRDLPASRKTVSRGRRLDEGAASPCVVQTSTTSEEASRPIARGPRGVEDEGRERLGEEAERALDVRLYADVQEASHLVSGRSLREEPSLLLLDEDVHNKIIREHDSSQAPEARSNEDRPGEEAPPCKDGAGDDRTGPRSRRW